MRRDPIPLLLIPVAALICILPLILQGPSCGHDYDFHILNWFEAAAQFRNGSVHPQWAFSPAWNAGEPRFVFYPPLSWTLGATLGLILPWTWTPIAYTWLALTASGLAMHHLARAHASRAAALVASTLYLANPYMLFTAYERTAYAELLAAAFLPLLFHAILKPRPTILGIAIPLALLWLTNAPAAVMGTYALALLAAIRLLTQLFEKWAPQLWRSYRPGLIFPEQNSPFEIALTTAAGTLLAFAMAAFYILPAATERPLVQIAMVIIPGMRIDDNTLFHHTGQTEDALAHDAVLHSASVLAILLLTVTIIALILTRPPRNQWHNTHQHAPSPGVHPPSPSVFPLAILTLIIVALLTPPSLPLWHHAPELAFLQFPWRLLAILATVLALSTALALDRINAPHRHRQHSAPQSPFSASLAALSLAIVLTAAAWPNFRQPCDRADTVQARLIAFQTHQGAEPTDEYTPATADNDSLQHRNPPFWLSPDPDAPPPADTPPGPAPEDLTLSVQSPAYLILNLRQYPAWHATLNGRDLPSASTTQTPRADGLLNLALPSGIDRIHLIYRATPLEHAAQAVSALALLLAIGIFLREKPPRWRWLRRG